MADLTTEYPLGPATITFDATANGATAAVVIPITLEGEDSTFAVSTETFKVMVDQIAGAYKAQHISGDTPATYTCSVFLKGADLPNLSSAYEKHVTLDSIAYDPQSKPVLYGTIKIHPTSAGVDDGYDFNGFKVSCNPVLNGKFKTQDLVQVDLVFEFSGDDDVSGQTYGKVFTIGTYTTP